MLNVSQPLCVSTWFCLKVCFVTRFPFHVSCSDSLNLGKHPQEFKLLILTWTTCCVGFSAKTWERTISFYILQLCKSQQLSISARDGKCIYVLHKRKSAIQPTTFTGRRTMSCNKATLLTADWQMALTKRKRRWRCKWLCHCWVHSANWFTEQIREIQFTSRLIQHIECHRSSLLTSTDSNGAEHTSTTCALNGPMGEFRQPTIDVCRSNYGRLLSPWK